MTQYIIGIGCIILALVMWTKMVKLIVENRINERVQTDIGRMMGRNHSIRFFQHAESNNRRIREYYESTVSKIVGDEWHMQDPVSDMDKLLDTLTLCIIGGKPLTMHIINFYHFIFTLRVMMRFDNPDNREMYSYYWDEHPRDSIFRFLVVNENITEVHERTKSAIERAYFLTDALFYDDGAEVEFVDPDNLRQLILDDGDKLIDMFSGLKELDTKTVGQNCCNSLGINYRTLFPEMSEEDFSKNADYDYVISWISDKLAEYKLTEKESNNTQAL